MRKPAINAITSATRCYLSKQMRYITPILARRQSLASKWWLNCFLSSSACVLTFSKRVQEFSHAPPHTLFIAPLKKLEITSLGQLSQGHRRAQVGCRAYRWSSLNGYWHCARTTRWSAKLRWVLFAEHTTIPVSTNSLCAQKHPL
jgi:hypothetical protein